MLVTRALIERLELSAARATELLAAGITGAATAPMRRGALVAMGPGRYVNRAMAITIDELDDGDVDDVVAWFHAQGLPPMVELCAWASRPTIDALGARGFVPAWLRGMFARACDPATMDAVDGVEVLAVTSEDDAVTWRRVHAAGFGVTDPAAVAVNDEHARADRAIEPGQQFLAYVDGEVAGCGGVVMVDGVAWVGGAATLPEHRGCGVQAALIRRRMQHGQDHGCDVVAGTALPDGASARNLGRLGFTLVQHQSVLQAVRPDER